MYCRKTFFFTLFEFHLHVKLAMVQWNVPQTKYLPFASQRFIFQHINVADSFFYWLIVKPTSMSDSAILSFHLWDQRNQHWRFVLWGYWRANRAVWELWGPWPFWLQSHISLCEGFQWILTLQQAWKICKILSFWYWKLNLLNVLIWEM